MTGDERFSRHYLLAQIGPEGQARLGRASALVVGCGGLGATIATGLVRSGVGHVILVDSDSVAVSNLHRQLLYYDEDVRSGPRPKVELAAERLSLVHPELRVEPLVTRLEPGNALDLVALADVVVDGTDQMLTRYVINDACVKLGKPWIYGGVLGTFGMTMTISPGHGPCLRCLFREPPTGEGLPTCHTVGVLGTVPMTFGMIQATLALRVLLGDHGLAGRLMSFDTWTLESHVTKVSRDPQCPACGQARYDFLPLPG